MLRSQIAEDMAMLNQDYPRRQSVTYSVVHNNNKSKRKKTKLLSTKVPFWFATDELYI